MSLQIETRPLPSTWDSHPALNYHMLWVFQYAIASRTIRRIIQHKTMQILYASSKPSCPMRNWVVGLPIFPLNLYINAGSEPASSNPSKARSICVARNHTSLPLPHSSNLYARPYSLYGRIPFRLLKCRLGSSQPLSVLTHLSSSKSAADSQSHQSVNQIHRLPSLKV